MIALLCSTDIMPLSNAKFILSRRYWIGLDVFNDDTRPSGHISRPTQVNVPLNLFSFSQQLLKSDHIVQSGG